MRNLFAALLLAFTALSCAAQQQPSPAIPGIAHVAIRVAHLDASRDFYQKLGFQQAFAFDHEGVITQAFLKINDRQFFEIYPQQKHEEPLGFLHVCFEVEDLQKLHDYYIAQGLTPKDVRKAGAGNLLFTMEGPEQQNIEYTQYMPGSRHTNDKGQHLGADRIADEISAVALDLNDAPAAENFYTKKLGFARGNSYDSNRAWLRLPGTDHDEQMEFLQRKSGTSTPSELIYLSVKNKKATAARLKQLGIPAKPYGKGISIQDPDGNRLVFIQP